MKEIQQIVNDKVATMIEDVETENLVRLRQ